MNEKFKHYIIKIYMEYILTGKRLGECGFISDKYKILEKLSKKFCRGFTTLMDFLFNYLITTNSANLLFYNEIAEDFSYRHL